MTSETEKKKREPKPLTALAVIQRVRGCGEPEAAALLADLQLDEAVLLEAYQGGAGAVQAVISDAHDANRRNDGSSDVV